MPNLKTSKTYIFQKRGNTLPNFHISDIINNCKSGLKICLFNRDILTQLARKEITEENH